MSIANAVQVLGNKLKKCQWKLVTAESCTGGGLAYALTSISGSSEWFDCSFVTYSNTAKQKSLAVKASTLEKFGAVSAETAKEMAEGALQQSETQVSIAITGIAGPEGGSAEKPVGTVWLAWKTPAQATQTKLLQLSGSRAEIREKTIELALEVLNSAL